MMALMRQNSRLFANEAKDNQTQGPKTTIQTFGGYRTTKHWMGK